MHAKQTGSPQYLLVLFSSHFQDLSQIITPLLHAIGLADFHLQH
jgi:hypothetical protein